MKARGALLQQVHPKPYTLANIPFPSFQGPGDIDPSLGLGIRESEGFRDQGWGMVELGLGD